MGPVEWEAINRIPGFMSQAECRWLADKARQAQSWTELGAYCGRSMLCVGLHLPKGASLRVVDLYLGSIRRAGQTLFTTYDELVQKRPDLEIVMLRMESANAAELLPASEVVFLDAAHDYEHVSSDILGWQSKCQTLCGHDYQVAEWPGVKQAVDELVPDVLRPAESIWARP